MATKFEIDSLAHTLDTIAKNVRYDADKLANFAQQMREIPEADLADISKSAFAFNVTTLVMNLLNTSNVVGHAEYAINVARNI